MIDFSKIENIPEVTDPELAFGSDIKLLPNYDDIPKEFKGSGGKWNNLFSQIFYKGGQDISFQPKEGVGEVELKRVFRFIRSVMVSFSSKHEHKEASVAYIFSLYFNDYKLPEKPAADATT